MDKEQFVIGVDFGTDSVRSVIIQAANGNEIASAVHPFRRWADKLYCIPIKNQFRQHPSDYIEGLQSTILDCLKQAGNHVASNIKGIAIDTTGSTPVAVNESGTPLALLPEFRDNPNAMFILWKDHTAVKEASEINEHASHFDIDYLQFVGGAYSSEWFWAKLLHILRADESVRKVCYSWVEHCDWVPFLLTGGRHISKMKRSRCAAGHKALWTARSQPYPATAKEKEKQGFPPDHFFHTLDPLLNDPIKHLFDTTYTSDQPAGCLCKEWADKLGLSTDVVVSVGAFDAHMGAVGGQIEPYHLSKVMGTSTCDMLVAPLDEMEHKLIKGICGQVPGSIIPGMMGMEAGQSAFGDVYAWFSRLIQWPLQEICTLTNVIDKGTAQRLKEEINKKLIPALSTKAAKIPLTDETELAIDWLNGRRTPGANQNLKAAISGLNLASNAPSIFRALAEATCFGAKKIVDCFNDQHVQIKGLIGLGGVARKADFIMQMMADVINMPIRIHSSEQTCAGGAAMFAATAAGIYPKVEEAMNAMGQGFDKEFQPDQEKVSLYNKRYEKYKRLGTFVEEEQR